LDETIPVRCRDINSLLEEVIAAAGRIDILKVDTEGLEPRTVKAIRRDLLHEVDVIYLESLEEIEMLHPESMVQSRRLMTWRLTPLGGRTGNRV
jgi:hypothetical protein